VTKSARGVTAGRWTAAVALTVVALGAAATLETGRVANAAAGSVQVARVAKVQRGTDAASYSIDYSYVFPGRDSVHIKNLGVVPARGSFHYISHERELQFRDTTSGEILRTVALDETVVAAGGTPASEIPREGEFPPEFRSFAWTSRSSFQERANLVLNKYFRYWPRESDERIHLATTFTPLHLRNPEVLGKVALLLSFPSQAGSRGFSFQVHSLVREGRTHSDYYLPTENTAILAAASQFVDQLVTELNTGGDR